MRIPGGSTLGETKGYCLTMRLHPQRIREALVSRILVLAGEDFRLDDALGSEGLNGAEVGH